MTTYRFGLVALEHSIGESYIVRMAEAARLAAKIHLGRDVADESLEKNESMRFVTQWRHG